MEIVRHEAGSRAYGTNTPESDLDIRGVFVADEWSTRTGIEFRDEIPIATHLTDDGKAFELMKFTNMCLRNNPNTIETLFIDPKSIIETTSYYDELRDIRDSFLSKRSITTFLGYAESQLKRIRGHNKWINRQSQLTEDGRNPFEDEPQHCNYVKMVQNFTNTKIMPRDFNLTDYKINYKLLPFSKDLFGLFKYQGARSVGERGELCISEYESRPNPEFLIKMNWERFDQAHSDWKKYWEWRNNRNEQRAELEQKNQYDAKHASHVIRLARCAVELNNTGNLNVWRKDAKELLEIRNGAWSLEKFEQEVTTLRSKLDESKSVLPNEPDYDKVWKVVLGIQDDIWSKSKN